MTNTSGSGEASGGERLARVTYLPGVVPPAPEPLVNEQLQERTLDLEPKKFRGFGDDVPPQPASKIEALRRLVTEVETESATSSIIANPESSGERSARAHNVSMHALTRKGMSSAEMSALLKSRDLDEDDVVFEVTRLQQVGLLDDHELASTLVRTLRDRKGLGRSAIAAELRRRKIEQVAIERALDDAYAAEGDDDLTRAREIAIKRAPQLRSLDAETARRRLGAFLMRKGYSGSVVSSAVASALASNGPTLRGPRFE